MSNLDSLNESKPRVHEHIAPNGKRFLVRALSGEGRELFQQLCRESSDGQSPDMAKVVALTLCTPDGELEFDANNEKHVARIKAADGAVLQSIVFKMYDVSGLRSGAVEEAEKKS